MGANCQITLGAEHDNQSSTVYMACPECGGNETVSVAPVGCDGPVAFVCKNCWPDKVIATHQFQFTGWLDGGSLTGSAKGMPASMPDLELGLGNTT